MAPQSTADQTAIGMTGIMSHQSTQRDGSQNTKVQKANNIMFNKLTTSSGIRTKNKSVAIHNTKGLT
jgi:hypothetical protein